MLYTLLPAVAKSTVFSPFAKSGVHEEPLTAKAVHNPVGRKTGPCRQMVAHALTVSFSMLDACVSVLAAM
jgi:hypothetical protein